MNSGLDITVAFLLQSLLLTFSMRYQCKQRAFVCTKFSKKLGDTFICLKEVLEYWQLCTYHYANTKRCTFQKLSWKLKIIGKVYIIYYIYYYSRTFPLHPALLNYRYGQNMYNIFYWIFLLLLTFYSIVIIYKTNIHVL